MNSFVDMAEIPRTHVDVIVINYTGKSIFTCIITFFPEIETHFRTINF